MSQAQQPSPVREGSRWRHAKPTSQEVADWFGGVRLDEGMAHQDYVSGVVLIPASEKVKIETDRGTTEKWEMTFTPYVRVDTRIAYFHDLAALRELVGVIEPVAVPQYDSGDLANSHMPDGFWWHVVINANGDKVRFLCCTKLAALYRQEDYFGAQSNGGGQAPIRPVRAGVATKVVAGSDVNAIARAETGASGRALGMAGILVVGTGIATFEDMQEGREGPAEAAAALPTAGEVVDDENAVNERLLALQGQLRQAGGTAWSEFAAWWQERAQEGGWSSVSAAPLEVRRGVIRKMEAAVDDLAAPGD